jgi:16S rRNA (guanine527-N7)-methyltransferase
MDTLAATVARHGIELPEDRIALLAQYRTLLWDWNTRINLTRHTDDEKFVGRDLADSLAFARFLTAGERILDVGTGGGVPGVILAIVRPELSVALAESTGKKAKVVADMVQRLGLPVPVFAGRAEDALAQQKFDTLVVRAVAPLPKLLTWFGPFWNRFGRMLVLKGTSWVEERAAARHEGQLRTLALRKLMSYPIPGTHDEGVLLQIGPKKH